MKITSGKCKHVKSGRNREVLAESHQIQQRNNKGFNEILLDVSNNDCFHRQHRSNVVWKHSPRSTQVVRKHREKRAIITLSDELPCKSTVSESSTKNEQWCGQRRHLTKVGTFDCFLRFSCSQQTSGVPRGLS